MTALVTTIRLSRPSRANEADSGMIQIEFQAVKA